MRECQSVCVSPELYPHFPRQNHASNVILLMRILLAGVSGQVGWELRRSLMTIGEVISVARKPNASNLSMDLSQPDSIIQAVREVQPNLIVNPAAYTAVDQAETKPDLALSINGIAPGILAEEAKRCGASLIHFSTDYVFDGKQTQPYIESDIPNPQSVYGKSKLAGEQAIQAVDVPFLIFRTAWVYGTRGKNFLLTMLRLAQDREVLKVVDDQVGSPTWSRLIAEATAHVLANRQANLNWMNDYKGIYHLTAQGQTSWYQFAASIFEITANTENRKLTSLLPIPSSEYPTPATRPSYSILNNQKFSESFDIKLPDWKYALELALN